jgi:hypothetical protein
MTDALADDFAARCLAFWTGIKSIYSSSTKYVGCNVDLIGMSGTILTHKERAIAPQGGTSTSQPLPTEVAVVVSLRSTLESRSGRGRMYLPAPSSGTLTDNGRMTISSQNTVADQAQVFLSALGSALVNVVASKTMAVHSIVTQLKVGDVFDAQRRRRDAHQEVYSVRPVT